MVQAVEAQNWSSCRGARVLVVDDDDDMRELLAMRLHEVGCVANTAPSGSAALESLRADGPRTVDLVLIDLRMPGINGLEVLRYLAGRQDIPAILMTGFADDDVHAEALALGIHVLEKPFSFETLRRTATLLLLSKRLERDQGRQRAEAGSKTTAVEGWRRHFRVRT
jgi:DNA-binding NtrC family response regulator